MQPTLSVIIPAFNESMRIEKTLRVLNNYFSQECSFSHELIIVDDADGEPMPLHTTTYTRKRHKPAYPKTPKHRGLGNIWGRNTPLFCGAPCRHWLVARNRLFYVAARTKRSPRHF
jgi:cellulose synthase/poly-beta-1,6-N-acetylglucosamine synthase-like glycosyltransferase